MGLVESPLTGVVAEVVAAEGAQVGAGRAVLVVESMKMEHEIVAPSAGVVRDLAVAVGDQVGEGQKLFRVEASDVEHEHAEDPGARDHDDLRPELQEALARRAKTLDEARPAAVERRHGTGLQTARENIAQLVDPGTFVEYGGLAIAAQRARRELEDLIDNTPADGIVTGIGEVDGVRTAIFAYDYTVLAGTQGIRNHRKTDRLLQVAEEHRLPIVLFAEGGGGRPGDTDQSELFHLVVPTFHTYGRLSGLVPRVGIVSGRCFAGNAALLGSSDVVIATPSATIGMGGPAMIEGGGLGTFAPEDVGPVEVQAANGVIDFLADDDAHAVATARKFLSYFAESALEGDTGTSGRSQPAGCADQRALRNVIPEDPKRTHDVRALVELLADTDSVLELRRDFGRTILTALARIEGRAVGLIANDPRHLSGAIDADGSDKAARFMQLCDAFGLPIVTLVDTPGFMVGPEAERTALVRHTSRLFVTAGTISVPVITVIVRRAFGLGAQAMAGGSLHAPALTVAWPTGELGAMGVEGAVRLALRKELDAIADPAEREQRVTELVAQVRGQSSALNLATFFEIDDVIDPAETRDRIVATLAAVTRAPSGARRRTMIDTW